MLPPRARSKPINPDVTVSPEVAKFIGDRRTAEREADAYQSRLDAFNAAILNAPSLVKRDTGLNVEPRRRTKLAEEILDKGITASRPITVKNFLPKGVEFSKSALITEVEEFLARRKAAMAVPTDAPVQKVELPAWARPTVDPTRPTGLISPNDILAQLFFDRTITGWQASAGRRWQRAMYESTLQNSQCVDWSAPVSRSFCYQARGNVTEVQWSAMKFRNSIAKSAGVELMRALDTCLDFDIGMAALRAKFKLSNRQAAMMVTELLDQLCACIAALETNTGKPYATYWRSNAGNRPHHSGANVLPLVRTSKVLSEIRSPRLCVRKSSLSSSVFEIHGDNSGPQEKVASMV